jgi:thioredoxin 1
VSNTKRVVILALVAVAFAAVILIRETRGPKPEADASRDGEHMEATAGALPRLVDLGANTCIPCKMMAPILEELKEEYRGALVVEVIDIRENQQAAKDYGIRVIPTQIFLDASGKEFFRHEGFMSKEAILAEWTKAGFDLVPVATSGH